MNKFFNLERTILAITTVAVIIAMLVVIFKPKVEVKFVERSVNTCAEKG